MTPKGLKLKDLARELGLTSRELLDRCRREGVFAQNSITRLSPADERVIRAWFPSRADGSPPTSPAE
jgi:hypothetical protein